MNQTSHQFNGIVWRMEIDSVTSTLFAEVRNEKEKHVSFASVNLTSGLVNFTGLTTEERWLTGMEGAYNGVMLLHYYEAVGSPTHKGIMAIDGGSGVQLWADYNCTVDHLCINGPVCFDSRIQPQKLLVADIKTGNHLHPYNPIIDTEVNTDITLPDMVSADLMNDTVLPAPAYGNIVHKAYYKGYIIVSLHALNADVLSQRLYIFKDGQQVFSDILNTGIQKLQPEAFVLHQQHLIYLVNRTQLNVIDLEKLNK